MERNIRVVLVDGSILGDCHMGGMMGMLEGMDISTVIFDRDRTLLRVNPAARAAVWEQLGRLAPQLPADAFITHWRSWQDWPATVDAEPAFWDAFWKAFRRRYQLPESTLPKLQLISACYHTMMVAYPDTQPCLTALRARGMQLAVLTNFELPSIDRTLDAAGLDPHFFAALLSSAMLGVYKPDPRAYTITAVRLEVLPASCLFVDDDIANVAGACAVGMRGVLLDRRHRAAPGPWPIIQDLRELPALLDRNLLLCP